ncbi:hypothetical protein D3C84_914060 [compost metagenome]
MRRNLVIDRRIQLQLLRILIDDLGNCRVLHDGDKTFDKFIAALHIQTVRILPGRLQLLFQMLCQLLHVRPFPLFLHGVYCPQLAHVDNLQRVHRFLHGQLLHEQTSILQRDKKSLVLELRDRSSNRRAAHA